jgi:hypothetical protein
MVDQDHFLKALNVTNIDVILEYLSGTLEPHLELKDTNCNLVWENAKNESYVE